MKVFRLGAVLTALALIAAACGAETDEPSPATTATPSSTTGPPATTVPPTSSSQPPDDVPFTDGELVRLDVPLAADEVSDADVAAVVAGDVALGLDLFVTVAGDGNLMLSPYSIATALAMLYPGARGMTAREMADAMHLTVDDATLHAARAHIERALAAGPQRGDDDREPFAIRPANSAWGQGGYPFDEDYLTVLAASYGAGLRVVDFAGDPTGATGTINAWVEDATEDRIEQLIPPGVIDAMTRLVLVNAVWFKANWAVPFDPAVTEPGAFTRLDGSEATVPLMHASQRTGYAETGDYQALRLPYAGDASIVVMLPKQGSPFELASTLSPADFAITWGDFLVDVTLPSFQFDSDVALKDALTALGMRTAFTPPDGSDGADLTGITARRELYVTDALHKSFIALDENGTEAAAATAIIIGLTSMPQPATFTADRPFLFWIEHDSTGEVLFLGQVTDPSA
jgi:serpin B